MRRLLRFCPWICLALVPGLSLADAYLDSLQKEASAIKVDPNTAQGQAGATRGAAAGTSSTNSLPPGLSRADFESHLEQKYFGSYSFYKKLDAERQERVYKAYTTRPDAEYIRQEIKQQYLSK